MQASRNHSPSARPRVAGADWGGPLLSIALFLLAVTAIYPVAEIGVQDDWAYTHIAKVFAATGKIGYNGWAAAMVVPQVVWAAPFLRIFGFSFLAARLSVVALGVLLIPVLYRLGRESGLKPEFALFVTLLAMFSPVTVPVSVSFMSDVPAMLFFSLCWYGAIRCWKAESARACAGWACLIAVAGVLSGLDRQIYWIAPLVFLPVLALVQRRGKAAVASLGAVWTATLLAVGASQAWLLAQPYTLAEHTLDSWRRDSAGYLAGHSLYLMVELGITAVFLLLPVWIGFAVSAAGTMARGRAMAWAAGIAVAGLAAGIWRHHSLPGMVFPGNMLEAYGFLRPRQFGFGSGAEMAASGLRDLLTVTVFVCGAGGAVTLWKKREGLMARWRSGPATPALALALAFGAVWLPALLVRSVHAQIYDRYLIPFLPMTAIPLLYFYQEQIRPRIGRPGWAVVAMFGLYALAGTHDGFAALRARVAAADQLQKAGIPRTEIRAGWEYDGWTQIEAAGHVNYKQIENPASAFRPVSCSAPGSVNTFFWDRTPAVQGHYFVLPARLPELEEAPTATVEYTLWLPPARGRVYTQQIPGGSYAACR